MKIRNEYKLQITFSKRILGIFKIANELSTLCGAEVGLIVFSPYGKVYCYGHPKFFKTLIDRFFRNAPPNLRQHDNIVELSEARRKAEEILRLKNKLKELANKIEIEKKVSEEIKNKRKDPKTQQTLEELIERLDLNQIDEFETSLANLKNKLMLQQSNSKLK